MAISVSALNAYVNEHSEPITKALVFGAPSVKLMSVMSDVKGDTALNILKTDVAFGDGKTCGWADNSSTVLTQRTLATASLKVNIAYCLRQLIKYWAGQENNVKIGIETLPFEDKFVNDAVSNVGKKIDKMIWYGNKTNTNEFDGIMTIAAADASTVSPVINVVDASTTLDAALYKKLEAVVAKIPAEVYNDAIVCMSVDTFRGVISNFESLNPYKTLEFVDNTKLVFRMPNSNVLVYGVEGLQTSTAGNKKDMIAFNPATLFYGCDYEDASETFKFIFNDHEDQFELHMLLNAGIQCAFLDELVYAPTNA